MGEERETPRFRLLVLLIGVGIAAVGLSSWLRYDYVADDAFITLRYVRNLATGQGYVFNPGERVEGATNLLWALLLLPSVWLRLDPVLWARVLGVLCAGAAAGLAAEMLSRRTHRVVGFVALAAIALQPDFACWAGAGLEGPLVALLGMLVVRAPDAPRWGLLTGLGYLTRPDGVLIGAGSVLRGVRARRGLWALIAIGVGVTLFRLAYFGRLLPNTAAAKVGFSVAQLARGVDYVHSFVNDGGLLPLLLLAPVGFVVRRREPEVQAAGAWILAQLAFCIGVGGDGLAMHRFLVPVVPPLVLLGLLGGHAALVRLVPQVSLRRALGAAASLFVVGATLAGGADATRSPRIQRDTEIPRWSAVGRWLSRHTTPEQWTAAAPIGALGYYSDRPILDLLGLTDAHIARAPAELGSGRAGHERHDGRYVLDRRPALILMGNIDVGPTRREPQPFLWERDIDEDPRLREHYAVCSAALDDGLHFNFWYDRAYGRCPEGSSLVAGTFP